MIKLLFMCYWRLSLLQESPDNTPYSYSLMVLSGVFFALIMIVQWSSSDFGFSEDLLKTSFIASSLILSYIVYTYAVLWCRNLSPRFVQTITSLFFAHLVIHIFASPLILMAPYLEQANIKNPLLLLISVLYLILTLALFVWQFVVTAHIYKFALNTTAIQSVLAAFGLIAANILTVSFWR